MTNEKKQAIYVLLPFVIMMIMFQLIPLLTVITSSFKTTGGMLTLQNYEVIFRSKFIKQAIGNSLELSIYSTILGIIISFQGAYSLNKIRESKKKLIILLINMISNFNGIPLAFSFIILFGLNGVITIILRELNLLGDFSLFKKEGLILMYTYFQLPLGIMLLYPSFEKLKPEYEEMASILGSNKFLFWRKIGLPVLLPEISGTTLILFANAMGAYACTLALTNGSYNLITIRITSYIAGEVSYEPGLASALAIVLGFILVAVTVINEVFIKQRRRR